MKKYLILLIIINSFSLLNSAPIEEGFAKTIAIKFLKQNIALQDTNLVILAYKENIRNESNNKTIAGYYVFNYSNSSFVIIAGDDASKPILGYSFENKFDATNIPESAIYWLNNYKQEINYIVNNGITQTPKIKEEWDEINSKNSYKYKIQAGVTPLVKSKWSQSPYYNDLCPYDERAKTRAVTGCVATAMAQIMRYWGYPTMGSGFHSYTHPLYGTLSANFAATYYDWNNMPDALSGPNLPVATLMYHCGVSVDMGYGVGGSGAAGSIVVAPALIQYFNYSSSLSIKDRNSYSYTDWTNLLKEELLFGRPIYYQGYGNVGGHAFVCDGFNDGNFFHFNWGWGGASDGYFLIDELNPGSMTFNNGQSVVIGIQPPPDQMEVNLQIAEELKINNSSIPYGSGFSVSAVLLNNALDEFTGDVAAAILSENNDFIDYISVIHNVDLKNNQLDTFTFSTDGIVKMTPGNYKVYILFKEKYSQWRQAQSANRSQFIDYINIQVFNNSKLVLSKPIELNKTEKLMQGDTIQINLNVINKYDENFKGTIYLKLINTENSQINSLIATYDEVQGLAPNASYTKNLEFSIDSLAVMPGNYFLAAFYKLENSNSNLLINSNDKSINPITVVVLPRPLTPDKYEPNNLILEATELPLEFTDNKCFVSTDSANIHIQTDIDIYKVFLPVGYNYNIKMKVDDFEEDQETNYYTLKASLLYSFDGMNWKDDYNNSPKKEIDLSGNNYVYFKVLPFFDGLIGTYKLNLNIERNEDSVAIMNVDADLNFNKVPIDSFAVKTMKIHNSSSYLLSVSKIYCPDGFIVDPSSFDLEPNKDTTVKVTFAPTDEDEYFGNIIIFSNARDSHKILEVSGIGYKKSANTAILNIEGNLDFGNVGVGKIKLLTMTLHNYGNSTLKINSIIYPMGFSGNWNGSSLGPNKKQDVIVEFAPTKFKHYAGSIVIDCNFTDGTNVISVSGTGVDPLSVDDFSSDDELICSPNPVESTLQLINIPENYSQFNIIDIFGRTQITGKLTETIDVSQLHPGTYFLLLTNNQKPSRQLKFVKIK
jgi:hypothetical protein